jgi:hypothetical protein
MRLKVWFAAFSLAVVGLVAPRAARAEVAAVFAEGHGGVTSGGGTGVADGTTGGLGFRLGARVLIFEGYYDYTDFGSGAAIGRGIGGLRAGFGAHDVRLVLRIGGGVITESGGALTGSSLDLGTHTGGVGRIGAALEATIAPAFLIGLGIDGETFVFSGPSHPGNDGLYTGSDVFANLHLMFELGI